ncbi:hypothetical protein RU84_02720 [Acinetobacter baumannii]|uniref:hypothetical protein n=1 Tax=Acinetobacter baumannii TaxID=470 RepID=UPI000580B0BE|nr:hypothetical protein [Acinetobacter baumannii]AJB65814.1 hypothetical protein RU84_02720 [Acinetobacter baumannii]EKW2153747.1 hypothetical protein [Acinetobacter baumannii]
MELVLPEHPIAHEAYEAVKAMKCEYIQIVAQTYQKSPTETGYFISGIFPSTAQRGVNRMEWISDFECIKGGE